MAYFEAGTHRFDLGQRTYVIGILNVTPDSFSDGGEYLSTADAIACGRQMMADGVDIIDVGGESTRPNSENVTPATELARILPVIESLSKSGAVVSVDTWKSEVARDAIAAGASIVNDIFGLQGDPDMAKIVAESGCGVIVMHNRTLYCPEESGINFVQAKTVKCVDEELCSIDVGEACLAFMQKSLAIAETNGIAKEKIIIDAGVGFGTDLQQGQALIAITPRLCELGYPVVAAVSRKRLIQTLTSSSQAMPRLQHDWATAMVDSLAVSLGADFVRVHNVELHAKAVKFVDQIVRQQLVK